MDCRAVPGEWFLVWQVEGTTGWMAPTPLNTGGMVDEHDFVVVSKIHE